MPEQVINYWNNMKMETSIYSSLTELKNKLLEKGFLTLPDFPNEEDLKPFRILILSYKDELVNLMISGITVTIDGDYNFVLKEDHLDIEDMDAQGITKWQFFIDLYAYNTVFNMKIDILIFLESIQCFLLKEISAGNSIELPLGIRRLLDANRKKLPLQFSQFYQ